MQPVNMRYTSELKLKRYLHFGTDTIYAQRAHYVNSE